MAVYLQHTPCADDEDVECNAKGNLVSMGTTRIYGVPLTPWTQLEADTSVGEEEIVVGECNGWQENDTIVIAPTVRASPPASHHTPST